jgi:transporter family protein
MSILLALLAAVFASFTAILAKIGIENVNSNLATAVRTVVVVIMAFVMVVITGQTSNIFSISMHALLFLFLSGLATGLSWLCYFKAIQIGDVSKVAPIDNSSIVLTIIFSFLILREPAPIVVVFGGILISIGTFFLIGKNNKNTEKKGFSFQPYLYFAVLSAIFAALTSILARIGIQSVDSNVATFIRTVVIIIFSWGIVFFQGTYKELNKITKKSFSFLIMSGIATGLSWLCYYGALALGRVSVVSPIDKLSVVPTIILSFIILKETPTKYKIAGAIMISIGTALLIV